MEVAKCIGKETTLYGGHYGNPHWHVDLGGHGAETSYIKMILTLIIRDIFRR